MQGAFRVPRDVRRELHHLVRDGYIVGRLQWGQGEQLEFELCVSPSAIDDDEEGTAQISSLLDLSICCSSQTSIEGQLVLATCNRTLLPRPFEATGRWRVVTEQMCCILPARSRALFLSKVEVSANVQGDQLAAAALLCKGMQSGGAIGAQLTEAAAQAAQQQPSLAALTPLASKPSKPWSWTQPGVIYICPHPLAVNFFVELQQLINTQMASRFFRFE